MAINSYEKIARTVLQGADPVTGKDGRLYLDGTMTPAVLSEAIAEALYVGEIFRDGQSVTKKYTVNAKVGDMVRVPLKPRSRPRPVSWHWLTDPERRVTAVF